MKKIIILIASMFLLAGCIESIALLGGPATGAANGKILQSSLKSAASYGIKKATGKSPLGHALAYREEKNPTRKKEKCISFIERTNSEFCSIAKKQVASTQAAVVKKISSTQVVVKEKKKFVLEKIFAGKNETSNLTKPKELSEKITSRLITKIKELDARWLGKIEKSRSKNLRQ
jgi:hypothetical protein